MTSGVAGGQSSSRISTLIHSSGAMNVTVGGGPAGSALPMSIIEYCCPSLRVRKRIASRPEKSTGCMGCSSGIQITPAQAKESPRGDLAGDRQRGVAHGHVSAGVAAGHLLRRHVPFAEAHLEPVLVDDLVRRSRFFEGGSHYRTGGTEMAKKRRRFTAAFKGRVAVEALR